MKSNRLTTDPEQIRKDFLKATSKEKRPDKPYFVRADQLEAIGGDAGGKTGEQIVEITCAELRKLAEDNKAGTPISTDEPPANETDETPSDDTDEPPEL